MQEEYTYKPHTHIAKYDLIGRQVLTLKGARVDAFTLVYAAKDDPKMGALVKLVQRIDSDGKLDPDELVKEPDCTFGELQWAPNRIAKYRWERVK